MSVFQRVLRRSWPVIIPLYDVRECPHCGHLVAGKYGQRAAEEWHRDLLRGTDDDDEPDGYILPDDSITTGYPVIEAFPAEKGDK